jgi:hypothetical protein
MVDRQSGGRFGWLYDIAREVFGSTDRTKWFMLWNAHAGDTKMIHGIKRGNFRLHPEGQYQLSEGCITVKRGSDFDRLRSYIRAHKPTMTIPWQRHESVWEG